MNNPNNSSDEEEINQSSDDNNFTYGAYGRKRHNNKRKASGMNDKERNLYGIFYEDDSDNDNDRGSGYKGSGRKRARKYDKQSNRLAGLSFVKAGDDKNEKSNDKGDGTDDNKGVDDEDEPSWLKEKKSNTNDVNSNQPSTH